VFADDDMTFVYLSVDVIDPNVDHRSGGPGATTSESHSF